MSNFYKPITIDNLEELQEEILSVFPKEHRNSFYFFYIDNNVEVFLGLPKLRKALDDLGLGDCFRKAGCAFSVMRPGDKMLIHTDHPELFRYSFNIPLTKCDAGYLYFYELIHKEKKADYNETDYKPDLSFRLYDEDHVKLVETHQINTPYIMDTTVPHKVDNDSLTNERLILLIRLDPKVDKIVQKLTGLTDNLL